MKKCVNQIKPKILAVIGSPRKHGNTYRVVEKVREHLAQEGINDFEYLFLSDVNLAQCKGCFVCFSKGEDRCPLTDDRDAILEKLRMADAVIFAAPSYAMGVPALMKNFIDRIAFSCHRPFFFEKNILAISTTGGMRGLKETLAQISVIGGGARVQKLGVTVPPIPMPSTEKKAAKKIEKAAAKFTFAIKEKKEKLPGIGDYAWFHAFKAFCNVPSYCGYCPADAEYYKEKKDFFHQIEGHPIRRIIGKLLGVLIRASIKRMTKNYKNDVNN